MTRKKSDSHASALQERAVVWVVTKDEDRVRKIREHLGEGADVRVYAGYGEAKDALVEAITTHEFPSMLITDFKIDADSHRSGVTLAREIKENGVPGLSRRMPIYMMMNGEEHKGTSIRTVGKVFIHHHADDWEALLKEASAALTNTPKH